MSTSPAEPQTLGVDGLPHDDRLDRRVLLVAGVVVLGSIMSILDMTVVGVAQNTFMSTWDTTPATAAWTITGYTLALAAVIPATGWAADRFGTKRLYLTAVALFTIGSLLCAVAWSIESLIAFRVLQGLGGGMLMPLGMTILTKAAGPERIGRVMAVLGIPMLLGPILGPILGGWLIEIASWHWIFLINLPIGIGAIIYAALVLPKDTEHPSESFDLLGFALLSPGLALFLYGVSSIPEEGSFTASGVIVPVVIGAILQMAFVWHALRKDHPLIDLRLFKNLNLTVAILTLVVFAVAFFGSMLLYAQYFIGVRGETTLMAGLLLAPQGIGAMVTMPIAGALTDKKGPGWFVLSGIVLILLGMAPFTQVTPDTSYLLLCGALFVQGLGMGMTMMPVMTAALRTLQEHEVARGSTLTNITQQVAASIGTAVVSVVLTNALKENPLSSFAIGMTVDPERTAAMANQSGQPLPPDPTAVEAMVSQGLTSAADAFGHSWMVSLVLVVFALVPAFFLPRSRSEENERSHEPVLMH
ncbi:DHA2 family efflux MFS transporter permease subunit [Janibacter sp. GXQ6167]|uniref:DHA2 family efflux MFS transporter permease subunit n=1 Tax=Janibacter sp. GXQ6167 TaxID=3240791 RepID=UPI003523CAB5